MEDCKFSKHPIHALLDDHFAQADICNVIADFQRENAACKKWLLFSDYCLDDEKKPNDVMTFVLMPFVSEEKYLEMERKIKSMQPTDIKKTRCVNKEFLAYMKSESVLTFSFILGDRVHLFAQRHSERLQCVKATLQAIYDCYDGWKRTAGNNAVLKYYVESTGKIKKHIDRLKGKNPNINLLNDILITAFLGAYVSAKALEGMPIEKFAWLSDRDKVISGNDNIIVAIFNYYQHNMLGGRQFQFCTFTPDDREKPFFDDFNRIADVITGALADYDMQANKITADKFDTVLTDFLAANSRALVFRITSTDTAYHVSKVQILPKETKEPTA